MSPRSISTVAKLLIGFNTYRAAVLALFFAGASLLGASAASAAAITVVNTSDSGPGSLRQALVDANDGDTIAFASSRTAQRITLTSGELNVDKDVTISGPGAKNLTVDGNWQSRVFHVNPDKTVTIDGLTVANGRAESFTSGGGIYNEAGVLTVTNCTFSGNSATNGGGGIANFRDATLTVTNCNFSGNSAVHGGGAIGNRGTATVTKSTMSANSASCGGGLANRGFDREMATLTVTNCTISSNSGGCSGGVANIADSGGSAKLIVTSCTVSGNSVGGGPNLSNRALNVSSAAVEIGNTIFARDGMAGENIFNEGGTVISLGHNISSDGGAGFLTGLGDQINTDPLLGLLQDNGGPTFTHRLLSSSPAIDAGDPDAPARDQRYYCRSGLPDIGALEYDGTIAPLTVLSRKTHGVAGTFDLDLPVTGDAGVECRSGGASGDHQLIMIFATPVTSTGASVTNGTGDVAGVNASGSQVTVNLTGVANGQRIVLMLSGVSDTVNENNFTIPMGVLEGDSNGDGFVNAGDALQTRSRSGQAAHATNFRSDVNIDGTINSGDTIAVRSRSGTALP